MEHTGAYPGGQPGNVHGPVAPPGDVHGPVAPPGDGAPPGPAYPAATPGPRPRWELLAALGTALVVVGLGVPIGLLWRAVAPEVELVKTQYGPYPVHPSPEGYIADDGWFAVLGGAAGLLLAILAWLLLRRFRGPAVLVGLTIGSVGGAVLAAWLGNKIGLADYERVARESAIGTRLYRPVDVSVADVGLWSGFLPRVRGVVLVQALLAAATYTALAGFHHAASLRNDEQPDPEEIAASWDWPEPRDPSAAPEQPGPGATAQPPGATAPARPAVD